MKLFFSTVCALLLLGCSNDSAPVENSSPEVTPAAVSTAPIEQTTSVPEPASPALTSEPASVSKAPVVASIDGGTLYGQKCASCHGAKGEKSALNKSQIIAQFSEAQVKEALKGYQSGSYGKEMKALMQGQAKALDDAQIDALAKHISNL